MKWYVKTFLRAFLIDAFEPPTLPPNTAMLVNIHIKIKNKYSEK